MSTIAKGLLKMKKTFKSKSAVFQELVLTGTDGKAYKAYVRNNRVMLAKDTKTGKFVKLSIVQAIFDRIEKFKAFFALLACVMANVFAMAYVALT